MMGAMTRLAPELPGTRLALVVATASYVDPAITQLRAPAQDAQDMIDVLADPGVGGFTVTSVLDRPEHEIRRSVSAFLAGCGREDLVLVYLSCHGLLSPRGRLYFAAADTVKQYLRATAIESHWLLEEMDECAARRQVLILDCCFSGAFAGSKGADDLELERRLTGPGRGRAVLTASRATEYSFEGEPIDDGPAPRSVFTSALVEGLRTGRADRDRDGYVSVDDAFGYAADQVMAVDRRQNPQRWLFGAEGEIILARSPLGVPVVAAELPEALRSGLDSPYPQIRRGAVTSLGEWLTSAEPGRVLAAQQALHVVASEDAPVVATLARELLSGVPTVANAPPPTTTKPRPPVQKRRGIERTLDKGFSARVNAVTFSPDGLLAVAADNRVVLLDVESRTPEWHGSFRHDGPVWAVAFSPDGRLLATGGMDGTVRLWDASSGDQHGPTISYHKQWVRSVAFSPDGRILASASDDGSVRLWDVEAGGPHRGEGPRSRKGFNGVAFSPDGRVMAVGGDDRRVWLWQPASGPKATLTGHGDYVLAVAYLPGGGSLVSAGRDGTVRLWGTATLAMIGSPMTRHSGWVQTLAVSPDGRLVASGDNNGNVELSDGANLGAVDHPQITHQGSANSVAFSPDSTLLASGYDDGTIRLVGV
jgi:hypothetical protein